MDGLIFRILRYMAKGTKKQNKVKQPNAIKNKQKAKKQNKTKQNKKKLSAMIVEF